MALWSYGDWRFRRYPENTLVNYTGIHNLQLLQMVHSDYDWYIKVEVDPLDGQQVLTRYAFRRGFTPAALAGKLAPNYVHACETCWSYLEIKGHGIYGYLLILVSADTRQLEMYEVFGD